MNKDYIFIFIWFKSPFLLEEKRKGRRGKKLEGIEEKWWREDKGIDFCRCHLPQKPKRGKDDRGWIWWAV
jgi:hypothetical protein